MDRESPGSSQSGGSFHYVDFRKNAVRGPDSHRDFNRETPAEVGRISWTRSPTRASRDGLQRNMTDTWTKNDTEAFQDLLPIELKRKTVIKTPERSLGSTVLRKSKGRVSDIPGTTWQQPTPTVQIPHIPVSSFADFHAADDEQADAWNEKVEIWFKEADTKGNGRIDGDEAVAFFSRTELSDEDLSKMWRYAVPTGEHYLNKTHFNKALKLVAVLQNEGRLTQESAMRAISETYPRPAPRINSLNIPSGNGSLNEESQFLSDDDDDSSSSDEDSPPQTRAFSLPIPSTLDGSNSKIASHRLATHDISLDVSSSTELVESVCEDTSEPLKPCLVSLQMRLPPLKSEQSANLRKIIGVNSSLIAAPALSGGVLQYYKIQENPEGVNNGHFKKPETEDADSAFCSEIYPSHVRSSAKVTCMLVHEQSGYLFLGYDDAFVEMHHIGRKPIMLTTCVSQWKAHKHGSIDAMVMTLWGDLWTGSSKGSIRVWSNLSPGKVPASRVLKRTGGEKPHGGVTSIVVSSCGSMIWTAGQNNIALWQAYSGEYLGRIETDKSVEMDSTRLSTEKTVRINTSRGLDLDNNGRIMHALNFGHRGLIFPEDGDGDVSGPGLKVAVGRVAKIIGKGAKRIGKLNDKGPISLPSNEDEPAPSFSPIRALASMLDRCMWVGYKNGLLERFTWNGRFKEKRFFSCGLCCLHAVGDRLWIGLEDGTISVYDLEFTELKRWSAHEVAVIDLTVLGPFVYSLAADGSIKSWSHQIPHPMLDSVTWQKYLSCLKEITEPHSFKVFCGTWNVDQARPPASSLRMWLCGTDQHYKADIIVLGLQEVEGAGSVAKTMTYGKYGKANSDKGSATANWWAEQFQETLDSSAPTAHFDKRWKRIALRQMSGIIIYVFARNKYMTSIGNIKTAHVGTGVMGVGSNKGGVAITFTMFRRRVTVIASHFAAHKHNVEKRNADYRTLTQLLTFSKDKDLMPNQSSSPHAPKSSQVSSLGVGGGSQGKNQYGEVGRTDSRASLEQDVGETQLSHGLHKAELLIWLGDFNYRVERTFTDAMYLIKTGKAMKMLQWDQCRHQMKLNKIFVGLKEGNIEFKPTYKFAKTLNDYDIEKERVPSWTDRIFFRGSKPFEKSEDANENQLSCTNNHIDKNNNNTHAAHIEEAPLIALEDGSRSFLDYHSMEALPSEHEVDEITVQCEKYDACMDVIDSDHKPVWCLLNVHFPAFIQEKMREASFDILREEMNRLKSTIGLQVSDKFIDFIGDGEREVEIKNMSECKVKVVISAHESDTPNPHIPSWLDIMPHSLLLDVGQSKLLKFTTSQKGIGSKQSLSKIYKKLVIRAETLFGGWETITRDYELGVLLRAT